MYSKLDLFTLLVEFEKMKLMKETSVGIISDSVKRNQHETYQVCKVQLGLDY